MVFEPASSQRDDEAKEAAQLRIFASLTRSYETGQTDLTKRHNDWQPLLIGRSRLRQGAPLNSRQFSQHRS